MVELHSREDIEKISHEILKGSKSFGVYPTPIDKIISYAELTVNFGIDLSKIHPSYLSKATDVLKRAIDKVQGILVWKEKQIYLDLSTHESKRRFVKLHEVGHQVLAWQQKVYEVFGDDESTLDTSTQEEFEAEANFFASTTLFQGDRFLSEMNKLGLGIESAMQLAKLFGSSIHAALRRYVEYSKNRCGLLVLENPFCNFLDFKCCLRDKFQSEKFTKTFGDLPLPTELNSLTWPFVQDYISGRKFKRDGTMTISTENGEADFVYHFFNNSYNAFVFFFPIGEKKSTRTKIIVSV